MDRQRSVCVTGGSRMTRMECYNEFEAATSCTFESNSWTSSTSMKHDSQQIGRRSRKLCSEKFASSTCKHNDLLAASYISKQTISEAAKIQKKKGRKSDLNARQKDKRNKNEIGWDYLDSEVIVLQQFNQRTIHFSFCVIFNLKGYYHHPQTITQQIFNTKANKLLTKANRELILVASCYKVSNKLCS